LPEGEAVPDRRTLIRAGGVVAAGAAGIAGAASSAAAAVSPVPGHLGLSVLDFGAVGDGSNDDTAAMQAALDASPPGGIVYLPRGSYRTSSPLIVPPGVTLMGTHGNHIDEGDPTFVQTETRIMPLRGFTGAACIMIVDKDTGGYPADSAEQRLLSLTLNGSDLPAASSVDGIQFLGKVHGVIVRDVSIYKFTSHGITTSYRAGSTGAPSSLYSARFERIAVKACKGISYSFNNTTDSQFTDLECIEGGSIGFFIAGCGNSCFTNCRAEWNALHGFDLRGGYGIVELLGCSTDRNAWNGVNIDANSNSEGVIVLNGLRLNRDGRNNKSGGGGYAGLRINGPVTAVLVSALAVETGVDDDKTGARSPQYGVSIDKAACVALESGIIRGATAGLRDAGTSTVLKIGPTVIGRT
jgi:polygalacturonase